MMGMLRAGAAGMPVGLPLHKSGKQRGIAVTSRQRSALRRH